MIVKVEDTFERCSPLIKTKKSYYTTEPNGPTSSRTWKRPRFREKLLGKADYGLEI